MSIENWSHHVYESFVVALPWKSFSSKISNMKQTIYSVVSLISCSLRYIESTEEQLLINNKSSIYLNIELQATLSDFFLIFLYNFIETQLIFLMRGRKMNKSLLKRYWPLCIDNSVSDLPVYHNISFWFEMFTSIPVSRFNNIHNSNLFQTG